MVGVGVGDASASPTAALLLSVIQESMGRIATILFAHSLGTSLEPECKMYRLAADVFNDTAMVFDCFSLALPKALRVILLSFSSVLRALCGVAAGSSKASLSAHFAKWGNLGELNAVRAPRQLSQGKKHHLTFSTTPILFSLDYELRSCFLRIISRVSTESQAEGLEPRNHNLSNGVRTFQSHCVPIGTKLLISSQAQRADMGDFLCAPTTCSSSWFFVRNGIADPQSFLACLWVHILASLVPTAIDQCVGWQCGGLIRIISNSHLVMSRGAPLDTYSYESRRSQSSQLAQPQPPKSQYSLVKSAGGEKGADTRRGIVSRTHL